MRPIEDRIAEIIQNIRKEHKCNTVGFYIKEIDRSLYGGKGKGRYSPIIPSTIESFTLNKKGKATKIFTIQRRYKGKWAVCQAKDWDEFYKEYQSSIKGRE